MIFENVIILTFPTNHYMINFKKCTFIFKYLIILIKYLMNSLRIEIPKFITELYNINTHEVKQYIDNKLNNLLSINYINNDNDGYIYGFINLTDTNTKNSTYVKIGRGIDPEKRFDDWKNKSVMKLERLFFIKTKCYKTIENIIHLFFSHARKNKEINGHKEIEWFLIKSNTNTICEIVTNLVTFLNKIIENTLEYDENNISDNNFGRGFTSKSCEKIINIKQCKQINNNVKYMCLCCDYKTSDKSNWKKHLNTNVHKQNAENYMEINNIFSKSKIIQYLCPYCGRGSNRIDNLNRHKTTCPKKDTNDMYNLVNKLATQNAELNNKNTELINKLEDTNAKLLIEKDKRMEQMERQLNELKMKDK